MNVIYHGGCIDGFTAAYTTWLKYQDRATYTAGRYGANPPKIGRGEEVIIVDFSYPKDQLEEMADRASRILILDHHKTAQSRLVGLPENVETVFDMNRSGASIAWDYFFPSHGRTPLIDYVEDNDLFRQRIPGGEAINAYLRSKNMDFLTWGKADMHLRENLAHVLELGEAIVGRQEQIIAETLPNARRFTIGGHDVPGVAAPYSLGSVIAHRLCMNEPFACYYVDRTDCRQFGLTSVHGGLDVSLIAEQYGGGGHEHASGFEVPYGHELARG